MIPLYTHHNTHVIGKVWLFLEKFSNVVASRAFTKPKYVDFVIRLKSSAVSWAYVPMLAIRFALTLSK